MFATFFGGCVFFGHIQEALIAYIAVMNISATVLFVVDKKLARNTNQRSIPVTFFTDYDEYELALNDTSSSSMNSVEAFVQQRKTRIYEVVLYMVVFCSGVVGAWLGMVACWHKIKKKKFLAVMGFLTIFNLLWPLIWLVITANENMNFCLHT